MVANEKVKVQKDGITKEIQKKDLPNYVALGWKEVAEFVKSYTRVI